MDLNYFLSVMLIGYSTLIYSCILILYCVIRSRSRRIQRMLTRKSNENLAKINEIQAQDHQNP